MINVAILLVSLGLGVISSISGAGIGLLITPGLILMGLSPVAATATSRPGGIGVSISSLHHFLRNGFFSASTLKRTLPIALIGSVLGTLIALSIDPEIFKAAIAITTILMALRLPTMTSVGEKSVETTRTQKNIGYGLYFLLTTLGSVLANGIGGLIMYVLMRYMGLDALTANATKSAATIPAQIVSFVIFVANGHVIYSYSIVIFIGFFLGGIIGSRVAVKRGAVFVKKFFAVSAIVLSLLILFI